MRLHAFIFSALLFHYVLSAPSDTGFVVSTEKAPKQNGKEDTTQVLPLFPTIYEMDISANISNRFSKALVTSKVKNSEKTSKEATFTVVLPEKAFISEFVMEIGGKSYKAYVKEKEEAKNIYNQAVARGQSAGHVAVSARDSNRFTVSVNIEPESKAVFLLTYEELLERKNNQYELVLNIHPGQVVENLNVEVLINESKDLKFVKTPSLRSGNEISKNEDKLNPEADIHMINSTSAVVKFTPSSDKQKQFARDLGTKESDGLSGQFVVQYDVERDSQGGEVLLQDGYFVHFFAPTDLEPLPKHVVFVLDTSGSMGGTKIAQLKDAMYSILGEITEKDVLNIVQFNNQVDVWDVVVETKSSLNLGYGTDYNEPFGVISENALPHSVPATKENIIKAKNVIEKFNADGGTHIIGGLEVALYLMKRQQEKYGNETKHQPIIIFLTDGQPNVGIYSTKDITETVTKINSKTNNVPIFSLSFGQGADKEFLRKLSLKNNGFSRHIYEASDASLQLQEFYKLISSPLLSNIKFKYETEVEEVTQQRFPIYFRGSELIVAGRYKTTTDEQRLPAIATCWTGTGTKQFYPIIKKPVSSLERLWAYLMVKQTLEKRDAVDNKTELTKKALDLALKYSFVTDVSSLVVVKPNDTSPVDTEDATKIRPPHYSPAGYPLPPQQYPHSPFVSAYGPPGLPGQISSSSIIGGGYSSHPTYLASFSPRTGMLPSRFSGDSYRPSWGMPGMAGPVGQSGARGFLISQPPSLRARLIHLLPWLAAVFTPNGKLSISQGEFELGEAFHSSVYDDCSGTPLNGTETGKCVLLRDCPEVYSSLKNLQVYEKYFCPVNNRFAGVCCPKKTM